MKKTPPQPAIRLSGKTSPKLDGKPISAPREEWAMFHDCPDGFARLCETYEYARESTPLIAMIEQCRQQTDYTSFRKRLFNRGPNDERGGPSSWVLDIDLTKRVTPDDEGPFTRYLLLFPEFPQPFLTIALEDLKYRVVLGDDEKIHGYSIENLRDENGNLQSSRLMYEHGLRVFYSVFRIDFSRSDRQLVDTFQEFLKNGRVQSPLEERGRSETRSRLKQLGALRLLRRMTWKEAVHYTASVLGKPLYEEQSAWQRAKRTAHANLIAHFRGEPLDAKSKARTIAKKKQEEELRLLQEIAEDPRLRNCLQPNMKAIEAAAYLLDGNLHIPGVKLGEVRYLTFPRG